MLRRGRCSRDDMKITDRFYGPIDLNAVIHDPRTIPILSILVNQIRMYLQQGSIFDLYNNESTVVTNSTMPRI